MHFFEHLPALREFTRSTMDDDGRAKAAPAGPQRRAAAPPSSFAPNGVGGRPSGVPSSAGGADGPAPPGGGTRRPGRSCRVAGAGQRAAATPPCPSLRTPSPRPGEDAASRAPAAPDPTGPPRAPPLPSEAAAPLSLPALRLRPQRLARRRAGGCGEDLVDPARRPAVALAGPLARRGPAERAYLQGQVRNKQHDFTASSLAMSKRSRQDRFVS